MTDTGFQRDAGLYAILAGVSVFLYAASYALVARWRPETGAEFSALFLLLGGILASAVLVAIYGAVRDTDLGYARWGLMIGEIGALGSAIHGAYNLAAQIGQAATVALSPIDPRGFLTFGVTGIAVLLFSSLMNRSGKFPRNLGLLGIVTGLLMILVYFIHLQGWDSTQYVKGYLVLPALLAGFIAAPAWYIWLGLHLKGATSNSITTASQPAVSYPQQ